MKNKKFPNGFTSWIETHHEVVIFITEHLRKENPDDVINRRSSIQGLGGMYELAEEWTDQFETFYKGHEWDGDFLDTIEEFLITKNAG